MEISKVVHKISLLHSTSTETPTPFLLAREMVDLITADWANPDLKILDAGCGRGTFLLAVIEKLEKYGHSRKHIITNMIYGVDRSRVQSMIAIKALRLVCDVASNIYCDNSLERKFKMKFDVVIGNPPYNWSDGTKQRKNNRENLWTRFISKSFEEWVTEDGYVAMVVPKTWMSPSRDYGSTIIVQDYFKPNQVEAINIDECARHFNVGSSFSYFVVRVDGSKSSQVTKVVSNSGKFDMDLSSTTWDMGIPTILEKDIISMLGKFYAGAKPFDWLRQYEGQVDEILDQGPVAVFHTPASKGKTFCNTPSYLHTTVKVMVSLSGRYEPFYDNGNTSPSGFIVCLKIKQGESLVNAQSVLDSKLYKLVVDKLFRYNGFINGNVLKGLPALDLTKLWTDQDIYTHFNLTKDEIDAIERNS
jgi:site-specific DNA-methyltransferase (adenine-specific)